MVVLVLPMIFLINDVIKGRTELNILLDNARIHHYIERQRTRKMKTGNKLTHMIIQDTIQ